VALKDKHAGTRASAAEAIGQFGSDARESVPALLEALIDKSNDRFTRSYAAISLGRVGGDAEAIVPSLVKVLGEEGNPDVREVVLDIVGQFGNQATEAVAVVTKTLKDPQIGVRRKAAVVLGKIGPEAKTSIPDLREVLKKETDKVLICSVIRTLGGFGKDAREAVPDLIAKCKADMFLEIRLAAIEELGHIGPDAKDAIAILTQAQKDGRTDIREAATEALKKIHQD
jgi:HEAT repeat protein